MRAFLWVVVVVISVILLGLIGTIVFFPSEKVRNLAVEKAQDALGRPVQIESADFSFWNGLGVKLGNVAISSPADYRVDHLLSAEQVDVKIRLLPLIFGGDVRVDRLIIEKPSINLVKLINGTNNYTFKPDDTLVPPEVRALPEEEKAAATIISFDKLEISDGYLLYRNDSSGTSYELRDFDVNSSLKTPSETVYEADGSIVIDTLRLVQEDTTLLNALEFGYNIQYDLPARTLNIKKADLDVGGTAIKITGTLVDPTGQTTFNGDLTADDVSLSELIKLLPPARKEVLADYVIDGKFSADLTLSYDSLQTPAMQYAGTAEFKDVRASKEGVDGTLELGKAVLEFKEDSYRFRIDEGKFNNEPVEGHLLVENLDDPHISGELKGAMDLAFVQPFLPTTNNHQLTGASRFNIRFNGKLKDVRNLDLSGQLNVTDGTYRSELVPEPIQSLAIDVDMDRAAVRISRLSGAFPSGSFNFAGTISELVPYLLADSLQSLAIRPMLEGALKGNIALAIAEAYLPPKGNPELDGTMGLDLQIRGPIHDLQAIRPSGTISVRNASYNDALLPEPIQALTAGMRLSWDNIEVQNLAVKFPSTDVTFTGKLSRPFPYLLPLKNVDRSTMEKPFFSFTLQSNRFDSDKLFPEATPGEEQTEDAKKSDSISTMLLPDIDGQGTFQIDTLVYSKVGFTGIRGQAKIYDRKIDCYDVTGKVYSGNISGQTTIDLNNTGMPRYSGAFNATQIEANDFVSRFTRFGGHVFGKVNLSGTYSSRGTEPGVFLQALSMNGESHLLEGKIVTDGALFSALSGLASKVGQQFDRDQALKNLSTLIRVQDGRVMLNDLKARVGNLGDAIISGYYGFDGSLGYTGAIELSREFSERLVGGSAALGAIGGLLKNPETGRIRLPLRIEGTLSKPVASIDYSGITSAITQNLKNQATDQIRDKATDFLENLLGGNRRTNAPQTRPDSAADTTPAPDTTPRPDTVTP